MYLSDVLPTAWQGLEYAEVAATAEYLVVLGLGRLGRVDGLPNCGQRNKYRVIGVDLVPERLDRAGPTATTSSTFAAATSSTGYSPRPTAAAPMR